MAVKTRIRRNDTVQVISGANSRKRHLGEGDEERDRGVRGKVLSVDHDAERAIVEGVNMRWKHQRVNKNDPSSPQQGRVQKEAPVRLSNLMVVCPKCDKATRIGVRVEKKEDAQGRTRTRKVRVCKKCGTDIAERI
jgi:large subunit ribosomal protein L24